MKKVKKLKRRSIVCNKNWKKEKKKRPIVNLILSHVNHTFLIVDLQIGP
jgi:hypothetical protein